MQLEYDAPGLFWIKKSHAHSILIFGPPNDSDPFLLHLSDGRIELRSIYGVAEVPDTFAAALQELLNDRKRNWLEQPGFVTTKDINGLSGHSIAAQ